ncbi:DNA helicase [Ranunculus cassubicifolius]
MVMAGTSESSTLDFFFLNFQVRINKYLRNFMFPPFCNTQVLKEGCLIILTSNINPRVGLCNGTRLICNKFYRNLIDAEIKM